MQLVASWNSKTPVNPEQRSQGDAMATQKNAERKGAGSTIASITTALWDRIEFWMMARTLRMLKTKAISHHSNKSPVGLA